MNPTEMALVAELRADVAEAFAQLGGQAGAPAAPGAAQPNGGGDVAWPASPPGSTLAQLASAAADASAATPSPPAPAAGQVTRAADQPALGRAADQPAPGPAANQPAPAPPAGGAAAAPAPPQPATSFGTAFAQLAAAFGGASGPAPGRPVGAREGPPPTLREAADAQAATEPDAAPESRAAQTRPGEPAIARNAGSLQLAQSLPAVALGTANGAVAAAARLAPPPPAGAAPDSAAPANSLQTAPAAERAATTDAPGANAFAPASAAAPSDAAAALVRGDVLPVYAPFVPEPPRSRAGDDGEVREHRTPGGASAARAREARLIAAAAAHGVRLRRTASTAYDFIDDRGAYWALLSPQPAGVADVRRAIAYLAADAGVLVAAGGLDDAATALLEREAGMRRDDRVLIVDVT